MFNKQERPIGLRRRFNNDPLKVEASHTKHVPTEASIHPQEISYFLVCTAFGALVYLACLFIPRTWPAVVLFALLAIVSQGLMLGRIRGNGIRVSLKQFPEIYQAAQALSEQLGLKKAPDIYIIESGGLLNAFATRFLSREYVVLHSDIVELAYEQGEEALKFVIAHELAHLQCGHLKHRWLIFPAQLLLPLINTYYRACEYTCDTLAAHFVPMGAVPGILALSAGKKLRHHINPEAFAEQTQTERGLLVWAAEKMSTHPNLPKRLQAVIDLTQPKQEPIEPPYAPEALEDEAIRPRLKNGFKRYNVPPAIALRS